MILKKTSPNDEPEGYRAMKLNNGDVMTIVNPNNIEYMVEYDNKLFYEVVEVENGVFTEYERTGKIFTIEDINMIANGGE